MTTRHPITLALLLTLPASASMMRRPGWVDPIESTAEFYRAQQQKAPEQVLLSFLSVREKDATVIAAARVVSVKRSGSGLRVGDIVTMQFRREPGRTASCGAAPTLAMPVAGDIYTSYLYTSSLEKDGRVYAPAAGWLSLVR